ncbi:uncharacterized protein H6S33_007844 [Morchella sextelata]|uniref:uncharacterized protein n=1 Tax=Morchella sextelata TaxID=1174677 RepID=UPI001D042C37|nr:uncharacterized protein H6S33_007844 [Morchella sextelata]KAH0603522.1 hypothetical protein H6S33_007844 [Morchella sextelata]
MHAPLISTLLLALAASVSSLSLGDLESIPSDTVTPGCLSAYNQEITACPAAADFKAKKTCSDECISALNTFSDDTILVCRQAFVSPDSLLRRLLDGGLVKVLCPAASSSSSTAAPTTTSAPAPSKSSSASHSTPASTSAEAETQPTSTQSPAKTKTESAVSTVTPTTVAFSGFMTITASSAASTASIPAELTLDDSAEPTVSSAYGGYAAYAVVSGSGVVSAEAVQSSAAAAGNGSPFESSSDSTAQTGAAAGGVKAGWGAVVLAVVALGAGLV